ncbi:PKD domain-containing protein [Labilibacter marinus]|uniref:PKD domain-containing protein n=1 Tax=Labilibacter marinus TaxID=1477105 RepID=UPI0008302595|nr:PKD domain-containing protein [Labilibacter marinus]
MSLVLFLFIGISITSTSQTNVPVCRDGVVRLAANLTDPLYMGAGNDAPPGHLQKGYWSETAGLTFSNINDPNAIISGFDLVAPGTTYNLTWYHGIGQTYDVTIEVTNNVSPEFELHNEDGNTANVLFCTTPGKYDFTVAPAPINPGASISTVDYIVYHADGSTGGISPAGNPTESVNLNSGSIGYTDLDIFHAIVSNGTCLDITTNTIQLAEISSVVVQIQGGKSACDPTVFDGSHTLEVLPFDPNNFNYQWQLNGVDIAGATSSTYTLVDPAPGFGTGSGDYTVQVVEKSNNCGPFDTPAVSVSNIGLPDISIVDNPVGSGTFEICDGAVNVPLNTTLTGGTPPAVADYDWYQNGTLVTGNNSTYFLHNDVTDADADGAVDDPNFNAFGEYYVVYKDANNIECKSQSPPVTLVSTRIDAVSMIKANNATPFCGSGTPQVAITITGGTAPYTLTFSNGYITNLPVNGAILNLPAINTTTTFDLVNVQSTSGCAWTGSETQTFNVLSAPASFTLQDVLGNTTVATCNGNNVDLYLSGSEVNVNYQLYNSSNVATGGVVAGTGVGTLLITNVNAAGSYYVIGTHTISGCQTTMGAVNVTFVTSPTATIAAGQAFEKCEGAATTFGVTIDVTPVNQGPWDIIITDGTTDYNFTANTSTDTWITPNVVNTTTYTIKSIEDRNGCINTTTNVGSVTIDINPTPNVDILGPDEVCINGGSINLTADITPIGTTITRYTWSTGVVDDGKQTITATPITQPVHAYSLEVESDKGCVGTHTKNITVNSLPLVTFVSAGNQYVFCMDDLAVNLTGNPLGGKFYVDGVELATSSFDPSLYTQGDHDVMYTYQDANGCENSQLRVFRVNPIPNVTLTGLNNQYCADAGVITMNGNPDGSGGGTPGIFSSNPFNALYFTDNNDGTANFNVTAALASQGSGNYIFTYVYTNIEGCDATANFTTTVLDDYSTNLRIDGLPGTICETGAPVTLTPYLGAASLSPVPAGETVSFTGPAGSITNNADGTAEFDPGAAGAGTHTITLNYTDANGCNGSTTGSITIGTPISVPGLGTGYCSSDMGSYNLLGSINGAAGVPNDGTTFDIEAPDGTDIAMNQANGAYNFIPSTLFGAYGDGAYIITYKYTDGTGCQNTVVSNVEIIEVLNAVFTIDTEPYATAQSNFCENDGLVDLAGHADLATASGAVSSSFTGPGVSGNGIAGGFFNPQDPSVNKYPTANTITHTVIHTVNGVSCPSPIETFNVQVVPVQVGISGLSATNTYCTSSGTSVITVSGADAAGGTAVFKATKNGSASPFLTDNSNNTATIDPGVGSGIYEITLEFTKTADGCKKVIVETVEVYSDDPVTFSGVSEGDKICRSSGPITLRGDMFAGGVGNFIEVVPGLANTGTDDLGNPVVADDGVAVLTPGSLAIGPHAITYEFTNANGCLTTEIKNIEIVGAPASTYTVVGGGAYCFDDAPQGVSIGLSGSNSGVTYELLYGGVSLSTPITVVSPGGPFNFDDNNDGTGADRLFVDEGIYTVKAVLGGCDAIMTGSVLVEEYELVLEEDSRNEITCTGADDGTITLRTSGGSGTYEYSDDAGATWQASPTFSGLSDGSHSFEVRDLSTAACEVASPLVVNYTEPSALISVSLDNKTNVGCTPCTMGGTCEGSATITVSGGTPYGGADLATYPSGYNITWPLSVGAAQLSADKLTASQLQVGTYAILVEDANGCSTTFDVTISENTALSLIEFDPVVNHIDNFCKDGSNGEFVVQASGGSGDYQFSIDGGTNFINSNRVNTDECLFNNLEDGSYSIIVRDRNYQRCNYTIATNVVITEPAAALTLTEVANNSATCFGRADGSYSVQASGGNGTYEFSLVNPGVALPGDWVSNATDTYVVAGVLAGNHSVWVRDANPSAISCTPGSIVVTVGEPVELSFNNPVVTNVSCNSGNDGTVTLTGVGGSGNYVYSIDGGTNWQASNIFSGLDVASGPYSFSIAESLDAACNSIDVSTVTLTEPADFVISEVVASHQDVSCNAGSDGEFVVTTVGGVGPFEYRLHDGTAYITAWSNLNSFIGYPQGTYEVSVRDLGTVSVDFCEKDRILPITISQPLAAINITFENVNNATCNGAADGDINITAAGGTAPYTYQWKNVATNINVPDIDGGKTDNPSNLLAGDYEVTIEDNLGCVAAKVYTVGEPVALSLLTDNIVHVTCNGNATGEIRVIASGGSGTYSFNVDNSGWSADQAIATFTATGLSAGDHTIWVRDPNSGVVCEYRLHPPITVNQPNALSLVVTGHTNVSCNGNTDGVIELTASGGSGNYDYYIDGLGWVAGTGVTHTFNLLGAANYNLQVRDQADVTCSFATTFEITEPSDFTTTAVATDVLCNGASTGQLALTTAGGVGPFEYSIDGGTNWNSSPLTGLSSGTYTVDVHDLGTGCKKTNQVIIAEATIDQPVSAISIGVETISHVSCKNGINGEIDLQGNVNGGSVVPVGDYQFTWYKKGTPNVIVSTGFDEVTGLSEGTYFVIVEDDNGCTKTSVDYVVNEPLAWTVNFTAINLTKYNGADGVIDVHTHTGSNPGHSIEWFTVVAGVEATMSPLYDNVWSVNTFGAGTYRFKIKDVENCIYTSADITLTEPLEFAVKDPNLDKINLTCYGANDGKLSIQVISGGGDFEFDIVGVLESGNPNYTFNDTQLGKNLLRENLEAGQYTINVTDNATGEIATYVVDITQPNELVINTVSVSDPTCNAIGDGSIEVEITGHAINVATSTITWSRSNPLGWSVSGAVNDGTTDMRAQSGLFAGEYTISVLSDQGCVATSTPITLTNPTAITATETITHVSTNGGTDGRIFVDNITSVNTVSSIVWYKDDGTGTFVATGVTGVDNPAITTGIYQYVITDNVGCTFTSPNLLVSEPGQALVVTAVPTPINCYGNDDGVITVNISSGVAPFSVDITGTHDDGSPFAGDNSVTSYTEFTALKAGTYQVNVTDGAGQTFPINNIVIAENTETVLTIVPVDIPCNGGVGSINLSLAGRTDGSESWQILDPTLGEVYNGPLAGNATKTLGLEGEYITNVTNQDGCIISEKRTIVEPDLFDIDWDDEDATIYGLNDGIIDVHTYTGNNGAPYTISWSDDATVTSFIRTDLLAGIYEFTIEDASGCDTTISGIVIGQPYPLTAVVTPKDAVCFGDTNGEIEVAFANPNNGGIEYTITGNLDDGSPAYSSGLITPASVNSKVTGLKAGTYTINATDSKGTVYYQDNIRIEQDPEINLVLTANDISCFGAADGNVLAVLNGRLPLSSDIITWSGSKGTFLSGPLFDDLTTSVINNSINPVVAAEEFYVVVESATGCKYDVTDEVEEPNELVITIQDVEDVTCTGGNDGTIDVSVAGRAGGSYRYDWYKWDATLAIPAYVIYQANGAATIDDLYAGNYSLTVTSLGDLCTVTEDNIVVNDGSAITINEVISDVTTCVGDDGGIITVSIAGGVSPYTVDVTGQSTQNGDGSAAFTFANLVAGNYVIEVSDARGVSCATVTKNVTIDEPAVAFALSNEAHDISCDPVNASSGTFTFDLTGGVPSGGNYNYQILLPEASIAKPITIAVGATHSESVANLSAGTYNLTVLDLNSTDPATCAIEYSFTLEHIVITNNAVVNTTCAGINNGAITGINIAGASVNYTYNWTTTDGGIGLDNSTLNQSGLSVGTYILEITDPDRALCSVTKIFTVGVDNTIVITPTIKDVSCNGDANGAITIDVAGVSAATSYLWTGPGIVTNNLEDQVDLSAGNYTVEVTSIINGETCIADEAFVVSQPNPITYTASFDYTSCDPYERTLRIKDLKGGRGNYTYLWDGPTFTPAVPVDPENIEIYEGGLYSITIKDDNQCEVTRSITVPNEVTINPDVNHVTCNGGDNGSIVLNVAGGTGNFTFAWTGPGGFTSTDRNIDDLYAGPYTVIITDLSENDGTGNCLRTFTININEPQAIAIDETIVNTSCFGQSDGQIEVEVSGGNAPYSYSWSPVVGANLPTNKNQYNLPADNYTLTVTDASINGGCSSTANFTVLQDAEIVLSAVPTETICNGTGGAINLTATGGFGAGFSYNWSSADGTGLVQGNEDQNGLTGGTYTVVVSDLGDGRSCTATLSETLTDGIEILNEVITPVSCSGNDDGTISYDVFGGDGNYVYTWNVISGDATRIVAGAQNQSGLSEGVYDVTITDGRTDALGTDCAITHRFTVTASTGLTVNVAAFDSKICFGESGGRLEATVTGGSGNYAYYWNGVLGTNVHDNLVQGIYGLRVVDIDLNCEFIQSYEIKGPSTPLTIDNIVVTDILCHGYATGAIDVTVSGGVTPTSGDYFYIWTGGTSVATGSNPTGLLAGTYNLTVEDANGCTVASGNIEVEEPTTHIKVDNPQITDVSIPGGSNGQILVDVYDGTAPRSVEWFDASNTSVSLLNPAVGLSAGTYRVVATDDNGCTAELTGVRVVEPGEALGFEKTVHQISPCSGNDNGEIHINRVFGGFPIGGDRYRIQITGPGTNVDIEDTEHHLTDLAPGTYRVIVTDNVPVSYQEDILIEEYLPLSLITTKVNDVLCFGTITGEISVEVNGGKPSALGDYLVEIRSTEGYSSAKVDAKAGVPFTFPNLPAGNYTITVKDHADDFDTKVPDRNFCELSNFMLITQPAAVVDLTSVSGDMDICDGDSYNLSINTSNWDFADGNLRVSIYDDFATTEHLVNTTPFVITVNPTSSRTYAVSKVAMDGNATCLQGESAGNKVQVIVHELPTANITGPSEVCEDGTVSLSVNFTGKAPFSFTWRDENNGTSNTITGIATNTYTFSDSPVANASYVIDHISDDNSCNNVGNGRVLVDINNKPIVNLTGGTDICIGDNTNLTIAFNENVAPYTITYEANTVEGSLVVNPAGLTHVWNVSPLVTTTYEITSVVDAKGCSMDFNVPIVATVIVNQLPEALAVIESAIDLGEVCQGQSGVDYSVTAVANATSYDWSVDPGMNIITGDGTTDIVIDFERDFTGGYVRVYAENACGVNTSIERWVNASLLPDEITIAPTGDTDLCEGSTGIIYSINPVANASSYEWSLPAGFILQGDGTGTSIIIDLDPNIPSTVGDIYVRPINVCSNAEPWSPPLTVNVTALPAPYAGADERICQTTYTLSADPLNGGESGQWQIIKGAGQYVNKPIDEVRPNAQLYNLSQGENIFVWTVTNITTGCSLSDTVIIYNDQVTVNATALSDKVCDGTITLDGTPLLAVDDADEAYWSTTGGGFIVSSTNERTVVNNMDAGVNTFTWTIRKGACYSSASVDVINNEPTQAVIYNASDVVITMLDLPCQTNSAVLKASIPVVGEIGYWRIETGSVTIDDFNNTTINVSNIAKGDHQLSWNILRGDCLSKTIVTVRNNALNVGAGVDVFTCDGTTQLNGNDDYPSGAIGVWTIKDNIGTGVFTDANDPKTTVSGLSQTNGGRNVFVWTLTRNGCASVDSVVIRNDQPTIAEISGGNSTISVCDEEYNLHAVSPVYGAGVWSVVAGKGRFDNPADPTTRVYDLANGDNIMRWTVTNNSCSSSVEFTVTNLHVDVYAGADTAVCGTIAQLHGTPAPAGATGVWSVVSGEGSGGFRPADTNPNASIESLSPGNNKVVWTITQNSCVSTDTLIVTNNAPMPVSATPKISTDESYTNLIAENPTEGSGVWTLLEGRGDIINPTSHTSRVENLFPNINRFRWTVTKLNCSDYVDVEVQSGALAQAEAGWDQLDLCEDFTTLQANLPENTFGEWTVDKGGVKFENDNNNDPKVNIYDVSPGRNVLRWTLRFVGKGSQFTTDTVVIINNKPSDAWAGFDITECGNEAKLEAREPIYGTPSWTVLSGGGAFDDDTDPKTTIRGLNQGENVIKYEITNDVCHSYDTISIFNHEPSEALAGDDLVVCADSAEINPSIPKYGEGKWRVIEGSGKGKNDAGAYTDEIVGTYVHALSPGVNVLVWEVQVPGAGADCVKRDTITITNNAPSISFAGHDRPICTDSVNLSGSVPIYGTGKWTLISGSGDIEDDLQTNTLVRNLGKGKNRFRWTVDNNGCTSVSDVEIANNLIEAFAGYEQINCADTAVLEANNPLPGEGNWGVLGGSGSANFDDNLDPYTNVRNLDKGENILTWTINHQGCRSVSEVKVTNNQPSTAFAGDNKATCDNSIYLGASNPEVGAGHWTIRSGGGKFVDDLDNSTLVDSLKFGKNIFRWTVEYKGCNSIDDVEIDFNTIEATVGGTQEVCSDKTFLEANSALPGVGTWTVVGGGSQAKFVNSHDPVTEVFDLAKGTNRLMWSINNKGCVTSAEVDIINHTPSTAYAGNTQELCEDFTILDATPVSIGSGRWEILTGAAFISATEVLEPKASISGLSKGENVFRWIVTSDNGLCTSVDDVLVINNKPSIPYAGRDEEYCSPTVVLKAAEPDFGTGNWSIIEGGGNFDNPALPGATISNLNEGVNVLMWTITQGQCTLTDSIEIINNTPTTSNAGPDIEDCKNYAPLDANVATQGTGYWTLVSGNATFIDEADPKTRVEDLTHGDNILMWNIQKGSCISSDEIVVRNNIPSQAEAGTDKESCEDYVTLNASDPTSGVGSWSVLSGNGKFDDASSPISIVRDLELGENRLLWTVTYGSCTTEDVVEIISNKAAPYAGEDDISYESTYELKASNPGDLGATWSIVAGNGQFDDNTFYNTKVNDLNEGVNTYRWTMDVNGCITYDDVSVEYRVVPSAAFKVDTIQGCYPLAIQFTNQSIGGSTYNWDFGDGDISSQRNPVHTFDDPGVYTVTLTAPGPDGLNGTHQMDIIVHDHPVADFSYGPEVVYVPSQKLDCNDASVDAVRYLWDFGDGNTSTLVNPSHGYTEEGVYSVSLMVESEYNCIDEITKVDIVTVKLEGFIEFPNAFEPRPDGGNSGSAGGLEDNSIFKPRKRDVETFKIQIFNRWGQLIYESEDIEEGWNGFFNNQLSPQGVYVWKATGTFISGTVFNEAGSVLLVR